MVRRLLEVTFPDAYHAVAARLHIGILRLVQGNAAGLAMVKHGELSGVSMPVVAIELNHDIDRRHEGINTEFVANKVLSLIGYADAVKDDIGSALKIVWLHAKLLGVHATKHNLAFRVFVRAFRRAIGHVVFTALAARWRPKEGLAAHFADMLRLVAALPFVMAFDRAKAFFGSSGIECDAASFASSILACPTLSLRCRAVALKRAITLLGAHMAGNDLAAAFTCNCSNLVIVDSHNYILTQLSQHD